MKGRKKSRKGAFKKKSLYGIVFAIVIFSIAFVYFSLHSSPNKTTNPPSQLKAAIVDHLSLTAPNQTFIQTATNILKQAGYTVDYYQGEKVNVEFYRNLPTHGYSLIILRVHSTASLLEGEELVEVPLALFTSEPYSKAKYGYEQWMEQIVAVRFAGEDQSLYFGIRPAFIKSRINGKFQNTIIIMTGCQGMHNLLMAEAFVEREAKVYVGWNGDVLASHTDQATIQLLKHLIKEKQTIKQAVTETMKEVGPDPVDNSILLYYPLEAGNK